MKNVVTIKFEVNAELTQKLESIRWHHAKDNQKLLAELFEANRGTDAHKESDLDLYSLIERFGMAKFAHVNAQDTWGEFLRDALVDEIGNLEDDFIKECVEDEEAYGLVNRAFESYNVDGTFTYDTRKSRAILFDYADSINTELDAFESHPFDAFQSPERFLVFAMIANAERLVYNLFNAFEVDNIKTAEGLIQKLNELDEEELTSLIWD